MPRTSRSSHPSEPFTRHAQTEAGSTHAAALPVAGAAERWRPCTGIVQACRFSCLASKPRHSSLPKWYETLSASLCSACRSAELTAIRSPMPGTPDCCTISSWS